MVAFLQSHKIDTLDELQKLAEDTKKQRSHNIHSQRELNAKRKKMSSIVDIYQAYRPYAEFLKKYESLSGRQKQSYYDKNADKAAMVQRAKEKQNETRSNLGAEKSRERISVQKRKHEEEIS